MKNPKTSVIMAVYNTQKYLAKAIESILSQTFRDFEFIIVDDGSTDNSLQILKKYALKDRRIKIISRVINAGPALARNEALKIAKGEYVAIMDADDIAMPERLEKQVQYLEKHPECVALGTNVLLIDPDGMSLMNLDCRQKHEEIDALLMEGVTPIAHPTVIMRRKPLLKIGGYRCKFEFAAEDFDLFLRLAEIEKLANLPDVLLKYRMHKKSLGHYKREKHFENKKIALKEAYIRRKIKKEDVIIKEKVRQTSKDLYSKWAWWALKGGNLKPARKYAFLTFLRVPFSVQTWKLLFCCLRGF